MDEVRALADRVMLWTLSGLLLVCACLAPWYGSWVELALIGVPALLLPLALYRLCPAGDARVRFAVAISLMLFAALMIHQSRGMLEFHFSVFCFLAFLLFYRDWRCIVLAALFIAVHHISFYFLQLNSLPVFAYPGAVSFWVVLLHAAFVIVETVVLSLFAVRMQCETLEAASVAEAAESIGQGNLRAPQNLLAQQLPLLHKVDEMRRSLVSMLSAIAGKVLTIDQASTTLSEQAMQLQQHVSGQRHSV
ncbi:hypothetical protein [Aquitalea sp. LB_tupeE]|uniref:hypothetical protein n=1 Tax=Aquitalea sp. LB_tupeE TaxID=2748078 RepID=UPI0015BBAB4A|nr:hypothetical protein [Aquitalea sp. LB_tupeE]NWK77354.1 hypothetical protein [Aquitalea sp. LB_tupeE]